MTKSTAKALADIAASGNSPLRKIARLEQLRRDLEKAVRWEHSAAKVTVLREDISAVTGEITALHDFRRRHEQPAA